MQATHHFETLSSAYGPTMSARGLTPAFRDMKKISFLRHWNLLQLFASAMRFYIAARGGNETPDY
jgi:hypothetical protein